MCIIMSSAIMRLFKGKLESVKLHCPMNPAKEQPASHFRPSRGGRGQRVSGTWSPPRLRRAEASPLWGVSWSPASWQLPGAQTREALLPLPGLRGRVHFWKGPEPVPAPHSDPSADEGPKTRGPRPVVPVLVPGNVRHHIVAGPVGGRSHSQTRKGDLERVSPGLGEPIARVLSPCLPACIPGVCDVRMGRPGGQGDFGR